MTLLSIPAPTQVTTGRRVVVRPAHELPRMTRYRGGTYSHTVDRIVFADGSTARTDLIRLNPNLDAYSLDFSGIAPRLPSRYQLGTWSALPHLRARGREAADRLDSAEFLPDHLDRRTEPAAARCGISVGSGQHHRPRSHRGDPSRDLVLHQRPGAGHPATQRSGRRAARPGAGHHLRIRRRTPARRLLGVDHVGRDRRAATAEVGQWR